MSTIEHPLRFREDDVPAVIYTLFQRQVVRTPDAVAVRMGNENISYGQLEILSGRLAAAIENSAGSSRIIGISTTRSISMIAGVIGILRSGRAYLPMDPAYPSERLSQMVSDAGMTLCICTENESAFFKSQGLANTMPAVADNGKVAGDAPAEMPGIVQGSLAYVLFTSGSTGKPKGVSMGQAPLYNLIAWQEKKSMAGPGDRTLQFAPLSFDVSFQEIFSTLSTGGTLVLIEDDLRLDPQQLLRFIREESIARIFVPFVALQYLAEAAEASGIYPSPLKEVMTAGEQLKITRTVQGFFQSLPGCKLFNQYGPTECHVVTELRLEGDAAAWPALPGIGKPIDNTFIYIISESGQLLPAGDTGELCIGGICLAEGYLNRPGLTEEKFIQWEHPHKGMVRIYKTGDLAKMDADGNIEFLGRRDDQVKIRGFRVEPGEIEVRLSALPGIQQAVVIAREDMPGQLRLVAYLVSSDGAQDTLSIRKKLSAELPEYMIPSAFLWLAGLPKTSSGKVDKRALPKPDNKRPDLDTVYTAPVTATEKIIQEVWLTLLPFDRIGINDNFFELGGNSLLAVKTVAALQLKHGLRMPVTRMYQFPTIKGIASFLDSGKDAGGQKNDGKKRPATTPEKARRGSKNDSSRDIAIIGMSGRFPGAGTVNELWEMLKAGREGITFFRPEEIDPSVPDAIKNDPDYVAARGLIEGSENFDAGFFNINTRLADLMDPQQRVFLEITWEVLEKTGYLPGKYEGSVGVFAGSGNNSYYLTNVLSRRDLVERMGAFQVMTYNEKDYVASRTAFAIDLKGPAVSVHSACSTSLLAIAEAADSLRKGQCDVAVAGGASITAPLKSGHIYDEGAMLSKDGHTRSFAAHGTGTVFSDGAGVVLLKTRDAAERDGDTIFAVIKGVGINNDGAGKGSFTAPSAAGQAGSIRMAHEDAGIDPASISYVEAHGTATPLGDPIEIEGLTMAFGRQEKNQFCAIGSIKSNLGHLTAAAGVTGLIKTVFALQHKLIPPSLNFDQANPEIDFAKTPFFVNNTLRPWAAEGLRRAGVSSFGVGGTNVHVVLEEYENPVKISDKGKPFSLIAWSAKTETARDAYAGKLAAFLESRPHTNLADLAFTLQTTRAVFRHRRYIAAGSVESLLAQLRMAKPPATELRRVDESAGLPVFVFPGQGSQYVNMGLELYRNEAVYRDAVDECAALLLPVMKEDIRQVIYPAVADDAATAKINDTFYTQPALFVVEYALARLWMSWGVLPGAFIGHSIGEYVAAHLASVFSLADGLKLVAARGRLMGSLERGSMLAVRLPQDKLQALLPAELSLAAVNSPALAVVAGETKAISAFSTQLNEQNIFNRLLHTSHAFHSVMMEPAIGPFHEVVAVVQLNAPRTPILSTVTGEWLTDAEATDPVYWSKHIRQTVRFSAAVLRGLNEGFGLMLESGPRNVASTLIRQQGFATPPVVVSSLEALEEQTDYASIYKAAGQLWLQGVEMDWLALSAGGQRQLIDLPTYAFDKVRHWVEPFATGSSAQTGATGGNGVPVAHGQRPAIIDLQPETKNEIPKPVQMRKPILVAKLKEILENASGLEMDTVSPDTSFIEMGLDSLLLTQITLHMKREFGVPVTFRQLNETCGTLDLLAGYLDEKLPAEKYAAQNAVAPAAVANTYTPVMPVVQTGGNADALALINMQIQLLAQQVALMSGPSQVSNVPPATAPAHNNPANVAKPTALSAAKATMSLSEVSADEMVELKKPFGAIARVEKQSTDLNATQKAFLDAFTVKYNRKTAKSKAYTQEHRDYMADPRVVTGFKPYTKEIVYSIVANRSKGSRLWDIDGNEYIDALNGFGSNLLGNQPDFLLDAIKAQMDRGYEIGPQHELAGPVSKLICEFTGFDRAGLCNTGSEAVLGAVRIARTVTGRSLIVAFSGSYHGINDEVIVRGTKKLKSFPAAPGIMPEAVENILVLDYGTDESLRIIRERAGELAAVLVEPVQSRRPEFQPVEFLKAVREITTASQTVLIFDEVITGFRMHPGGAQALFGIRADLGTYGKVIAGGMPFGVIAGKKQYMDALDGGTWKYGDDSIPEAGVTYFAGTFVRHPLALAAAKASLDYMKAKGPGLQESITAKAKRLADGMNRIAEERGLPLYIARFGSLWKIKFKKEYAYSELLFTLMREKGIHIWDGFPCFMTDAHSIAEVDRIIEVFENSVDELLAAEFIPAETPVAASRPAPRVEETPPVAGARLGRDQQGNPAWFISDPGRPGKYLQVK